MKNQKLKILILIFLILVSIISVFFILKNKSVTKTINITNSPPPSLPRTLIEEKTHSIASGQEAPQTTLEINHIKYQSEIVEETTVADFMEKLKSEGKIDFQEKNYIGMGKFIESINGIKNGEKNWIYYVNGKKANIGISNYKINQRDIVSWKYESR
ncbi:MAG: DUF4430 domain-containing protein [bacterium]